MESLAIRADFPQAPVFFGASQFGKQQAPGVEMEYRIDQGFVVAGLIERRSLRLGAYVC